MKKLAVMTLLVSFSSFAAIANEKQLQQQFDSATIQQLAIDNGVGELLISASPDDKIRVSIQVKGTNKWFFGRSDVSKAELVSSSRDGVLQLEVPQDDSEQKWTVALPAKMALQLNLGVGEVKLLGVSGDITADIGVGSFSATVPVADYGTIALNAGVGEVSLHDATPSYEDSHLTGGELSYQGTGSRQINVTVGVGEAAVRNQR